MSGKNKTAFTLAEIMISIGIIGILAILMLSTTQFSNKDEKVIIGKKQQAESLVVSVSKALASADTTGLALTALTQNDDSLRDGFAPKLNTKNSQAVVSDFSGYNTPEKFKKPASLPGVELVNGTTIAFQKLNSTCSAVSDGGAPCALAYVDVNEKAAGGETPQFLMAIYRDRAVSEYELCEGYEGGKTTDVECPANLPNGNKKKVETCNLGVITATYSGVCCPSDQTPNGSECVCKNSDMKLVDGTCVCTDNKVNINGACVCEGKTESCQGNMVGANSYDGICNASGKSYTLKESTCKCPSNLPNLKSDGKTCVAACNGGKIWNKTNDICQCPDSLPEEINGVCTCANIVESCTSPQTGNITYATTCSASGKTKGDEINNTCSCPSKDKLSLGDKELYSPQAESCKTECPDVKVANSAHTACVCPNPLVEKDGTCGCPQSPPTGYLAYNEAWDPSNTKTCKRLQKVFIVASYPTASASMYNAFSELTVEAMIKDFAIPTPTNDSASQYLGHGDRTYNCGRDYDKNRTYKGCSGFSGSWYHNLIKSNDEAWMNLLSKMSDTDKKLLFYGGKGYVFLEDGKLLATINSTQAALVQSWVASSTATKNPKFELVSDLGIEKTKNINVGEEGAGGQIKYDGVLYDVIYTIYRKQTPLVLDLKGDDLKFTNIANGVVFDLNADGDPEKTAWTDVQSEFDDSFLAYDKNNNGIIDNGAELFGAQNGSENGFYELMRYDDNQDNVINKKDDIFEKLKLWCDMNKNGEVNDGELKTLDEAKVTEISLSFEKKYDENGNLIEDEHGNTTGLVGSFKILTEQVVDGVSQMVESIHKMIDVLFNTIQSFFS